MTADALLSIRSIAANYGAIHALRNVSLEIYQGEIVSLIGGNGAGKSTTLMCISSIKEIASGSILFRGREISNSPSHQLVSEGIAQVPEGRKIFPRLSVQDNLELGAYTRQRNADLKSEYEYIYTLFPVLADRKRQSAGTLSGGEQQMLAIGRALMSKPSLLLLDEPSMGIAPILVKKIFSAIEQLNKGGMTILLVEQNAHLALELAHRAYVIEIGEIVLTGKGSELLSDPRVKEAYLGD